MRYLLAAVLLMPSLAFAGPKHAPLPEELTTAKTIYIVNQSGDQDVVDGAYAAFSEWGRFTVAKSRETADVVAIFTMQQRLNEGTTVRRLEMDIKGHSPDDALFETICRRDAFHAFASAGKNCVNDFRKRF